jgi:hypothetical protein
MEVWRCCAPVGVDGGAPVRSGDIEVADGVQRDAGKMRVARGRRLLPRAMRRRDRRERGRQELRVMVWRSICCMFWTNKKLQRTR